MTYATTRRREGKAAGLEGTHWFEKHLQDASKLLQISINESRQKVGGRRSEEPQVDSKSVLSRKNTSLNLLNGTLYYKFHP